MTVNSNEILVPSRAHVYLAPTGTIAPTTSVDDLDPAWIDVGYTTPDSLQFATAPEFAEVDSHQSDFPVRQMQTKETATLQVDLQQWNTDNLIGAFGGGEVTQPDAATNPGEFKFTPPKLGARDEKSVIIEVIDGTKNYRWVFPRVMQIEGVTATLQKGQEARLPLQLTVLGDDVSDPFYLLTNDPAYAAA